MPIADHLHGHSGQGAAQWEFHNTSRRRKTWHHGTLVLELGPKRPFTQKQIWTIRFLLDREQRLRDRALLDLAIDSKLRGCDLVQLKIGDLVLGPEIRTRAAINIVVSAI